MIVTLTANPSHDRTVTLSEPLRHGSVQRLSLIHISEQSRTALENAGLEVVVA